MRPLLSRPRLACVLLASIVALSAVVQPDQLVMRDASAASGSASALSTTQETLTPGRPGQAPRAQPLTAQRAAELQQRVLDRRARSLDSEAVRHAGTSGNGAARRPAGRAVNVQSAAPSAPSDLSVPRHLTDLPAVNPGNSIIAGPVAVNNGRELFYAGNTHVEFSTDGGHAWQSVAIQSGTAAAPLACCLLDAVRDPARSLTIWSVLYVDAQVTSGVARIYARPSIRDDDACYYDVYPGPGIVPDFPRLGLSTNSLYVSTSNVSAQGWLSTQVRRFSLDQLSNCESLNASVFTFRDRRGQRILVPVDGARRTMYFGYLKSRGALRVLSWPEGSTRLAARTVSVAPTTFGEPDCRGGANNAGWMRGVSAPHIAGFDLRGVVANGKLLFLWPGVADRGHQQAYVHAAVLRESDFRVLDQPHLFSDDLCLGLPAVSANTRGDLGLALAGGGRAGGGGLPVQGFVGMADDYTGGFGVFPTIYLATPGTHNPPDGRFGDTYSIRPASPCGLFWTAASYALSGGTAVQNVNARYIEFGRERDRGCWDVANP
ncbi:MAG: hypothetical protein IT307_06205 [Chloroflexi bacterium]|nr:hypothetical protein [Chloroflexota bacterium]